MQRGLKVEVKCKNCRQPFMARKADIARGWGKFCSKSCKAIKQESRTGQYANMVHGGQKEKSRGNGRIHPYVDNETYLYYERTYGGTPQFSRSGHYEGFRMSKEEMAFGGYGDSDIDTPFGEGKF